MKCIRRQYCSFPLKMTLTESLFALILDLIGAYDLEQMKGNVKIKLKHRWV